MSWTYEQLSQMYEPNDPKLWSLLDTQPEYQYDYTEADLYPDSYVSEPETTDD